MKRTSVKIGYWAALICIALICNGIICLLGGVGYVFDIVALVFLTLNLGMGGAVLTASVGLFLYFRRLGKEMYSIK